MPYSKVHWHSLRETEGPDVELHVFGIEYRDGEKLYLLIPDPAHPMDVFYSEVSQYEVVDSSIPAEWELSDAQLTALDAQAKPADGFWAYPIFKSSEDFVWRLSEGDLTDREKSAVMGLLERADRK